jgi:hypothetical protein
MPLGGARDEHFSCFNSSCQLGLNTNDFRPILTSTSLYLGMYQCIMKTEGGEAKCSVKCEVDE